MSEDERDHGIQFPQDANGRRSSIATGKRILAAAVEPIDAAVADALLSESKWRDHYPQHIYNQVLLGLETPENGLEIARNGLNAVYDQFEFVRADGKFSLREACAAPTGTPLHTATIHGTGSPPPEKLSIPYHGEQLVGQQLLAQLGEWEEQGVVEPSHANAIRSVKANPEWLDLSDLTFVLLGAGAEMGPLLSLLRYRANVVAVDIADTTVWRHLINLAHRSNGKFHFPLRTAPTENMSDTELAQQAGCDLLTETPQIAAWLMGFADPLTIGSYAYLDGTKHVRVVLAMDAIADHLLANRADVALAYLLTPTDVYAVPHEAADIARERYAEWKTARAWSNPKIWQEPLNFLSGGRFFTPNVVDMITAADGNVYGITDCLVTQQGPNYALAKRMQQWRALVARADGAIVSANVAPATITHSVIKNQALAAAYAGASRFEIEIFHPETSNALMAALLIHDLRNPKAASNPAVKLAHPYELFMQGAAHNGLWRTGFRARSVLEIAAVLGWRHAQKST